MESSQNILTRYQDFQNKRVRPEDYVKQYGAELGVDKIRGRVSDARSAIRATEGTIAATPASVAGRTSGSLVSDAARTALVQQEIAPLQEIMGTQTAAFGDARSDLEDTLSDVNSRASASYNADSEKANNIMSLYGAALQYEQEQERKRQFEEQMKLERQKVRLAGSSLPRPTLSPNGSVADLLAMPGVVQNDPKRGGAGGFTFKDLGGAPTSVENWARLNGLELNDVVYSLAKSGDPYAASAYQSIVGNGGNVNDDIRRRYKGIFNDVGGLTDLPNLLLSTARNTAGAR